MKFLRLLLVLGYITSSCALSSALQQSSVVVIAKDKDNKTVELSSADLEVKLDGIQTTVQQIQRLSNVPIHYCFLFDTSKSEVSKFKLQQSIASEVLTKVVHQGDPGVLVDFNEDTFLDGQSNDPQKLATILNNYTHLQGGTALYDAMIACADLMNKQFPGVPGLRAMFVFSDGGDNLSKSTKNAALQAVQKNGIRVFALGPFQDRKGDDNLRYISEKSGGEMFFLAKDKDIDKTISNLSNLFNNVFDMTLSAPIQQDRQLRKLEIKVVKKDISLEFPEHY